MLSANFTDGDTLLPCWKNAPKRWTTTSNYIF